MHHHAQQGLLPFKGWQPGGNAVIGSMPFYLDYMDSALKPDAKKKKKITLDLQTERSSYSQAWQSASLFLAFGR